MKSYVAVAREAVRLYFLPLREVASFVDRLTTGAPPSPHPSNQAADLTMSRTTLPPVDARVFAIRALTDALRSTLALSPEKDPVAGLRSVMRALKESGAPEDELDWPARHVALGIVYTQMGEYTRAFEMTRRALRGASRSNDNASLIAAGLSMGWLYYVQANYPRALSWYSYVSARIPHTATATALDTYLDIILAKHRAHQTYDTQLVMKASDLASGLEATRLDPLVTPWLHLRRHLVFDLQSAITAKPPERRIAEVLDEFDRLKAIGK